MKKVLLSLGAAALLFTACTQKNAADFNNTVVDLSNRYGAVMNADVLRMTVNPGNRGLVEKAVTRLEKMTDSCINVMKTLTPPEEGKDFYNAEMAMYTLMKTEYIPHIKKILAAEGNEEVQTRLTNEYKVIMEKIEKAETDAQEAQQAFARKAGMEVR